MCGFFYVSGQSPDSCYICCINVQSGEDMDNNKRRHNLSPQMLSVTNVKYGVMGWGGLGWGGGGGVQYEGVIWEYSGLSGMRHSPIHTCWRSSYWWWWSWCSFSPFFFVENCFETWFVRKQLWPSTTLASTARERKHQNWWFCPQNFYSDKNLIPHLIDSFFSSFSNQWKSLKYFFYHRSY